MRIKGRHTFLLILALGLILRLMLLVFFWDKPLTIVDETHYQAISENILNHHEFSQATGRPTAIRPPLYPAFLSLVYWIAGGAHLNAVRIVQIFASLALITMVYLLARKLFDDRIGLLSALIVSLYPTYLFFTHLLLTEVLSSLLLVFFVWFYVLTIQDRRWFYPLSAGFFLGLGALTRSILGPFLPIAILFMAWACAGTALRRVKYALLLFAGFGLVVFPWTIRNATLFHKPVLIDTMGGLNLYMGNYEHTPLNRAWAAVDLTGDKVWYYGHESVLGPMNEAQKSAWAMEAARQFMMDNKLLTLKRTLIKAGDLWGLEREIIGCLTNGHFPELTKGFYLAGISSLILGFYIVVAISSIFGMAFTIRREAHGLIFILVIALYFTGIHAIVFGHSRYHLPLIPLLVIFASWALLNSRSILGNRDKWHFGLSLACSGVLIGVWCREVWIDIFRYLDAFGP